MWKCAQRPFCCRLIVAVWLQAERKEQGLSELNALRKQVVALAALPNPVDGLKALAESVKHAHVYDARAA